MLAAAGAVGIDPLDTFAPVPGSGKMGRGAVTTTAPDPVTWPYAAAADHLVQGSTVRAVPHPAHQHKRWINDHVVTRFMTRAFYRIRS